jgi:Carboxypeptidase regulatory-like domain
MASLRVTLITVLSLSVSTMTLTAQTYQGGVRGAVRDANGVIPGADVALVNEETGLTRAMVTNAVGEYAFPNVLPGI